MLPRLTKVLAFLAIAASVTYVGERMRDNEIAAKQQQEAQQLAASEKQVVASEKKQRREMANAEWFAARVADCAGFSDTEPSETETWRDVCMHWGATETREIQATPMPLACVKITATRSWCPY
jgi:hypothetical protein